MVSVCPAVQRNGSDAPFEPAGKAAFAAFFVMEYLACLSLPALLSIINFSRCTGWEGRPGAFRRETSGSVGTVDLIRIHRVSYFRLKRIPRQATGFAAAGYARSRRKRLRFGGKSRMRGRGMSFGTLFHRNPGKKLIIRFGKSIMTKKIFDERRSMHYELPKWLQGCKQTVCR